MCQQTHFEDPSEQKIMTNRVSLFVARERDTEETKKERKIFLSDLTMDIKPWIRISFSIFKKVQYDRFILIQFVRNMQHPFSIAAFSWTRKTNFLHQPCIQIVAFVFPTDNFFGHGNSSLHTLANQEDGYIVLYALCVNKEQHPFENYKCPRHRILSKERHA